MQCKAGEWVPGLPVCLGEGKQVRLSSSITTIIIIITTLAKQAWTQALSDSSSGLVEEDQEVGC